MENRTPLVLLPGLLCDATLWRHQVDALADLARITVADLTRHDNVAHMAQAVLAEAPETFALVGFSMGGYVAQRIIRSAPHRVSRLALMDTAARPSTPEYMKDRRAYLELARRGQFKGVTRRLLRLFIHPDRMDDAELTMTILEMNQRAGMEVFFRQQEAILNRPDGSADLARIACPTLVLCGRQDQLTPLDRHREMADAIPGATLVVIEDCGHMSTLERPEAVTAALRAWLQGG